MKEHSISLVLAHSVSACAVFREQTLVLWDARKLPSTLIEASKAITAQISRQLQAFNISAAVLEQPFHETRRLTFLRQAAKDDFRRAGVPIFEVAESEVLTSFSLPQAKDREELRRVAATLFPNIPTNGLFASCLDAAALCLHFQTNRLLSANHAQG